MFNNYLTIEKTDLHNSDNLELDKVSTATAAHAAPVH